ncbi:MAG: hypothetical protein QGG88_01525 [Gammaproteobacteria bacterium]|jgi:hypothetical protein|nr:hypothetical protein [Gammaproteobacteria bacterium]
MFNAIESNFTKACLGVFLLAGVIYSFKLSLDPAGFVAESGMHEATTNLIRNLGFVYLSFTIGTLLLMLKGFKGQLPLIVMMVVFFGLDVAHGWINLLDYPEIDRTGRMVETVAVACLYLGLFNSRHEI